MDSDELLEWVLSDDDGDFNKLSVSNPRFEEDEEDDLGYVDALATPMIQVFCVIVDTIFDDNDTPCEIYGSIRAVEGQHTSFHLYDRDLEDSETIRKHGTLSLIGPQDGVMLPFTGVTLDLCLRDKIREVEVVKGIVSFDSLIEEQGEGDCFDKLMKVAIQGEHGSAYVYYAIFQFSIWCTVKVAITDLKGNGSGSFSDIYGSLVASYGNSRRYCCSDDEMKYLESTLFKKPYDKPMHIMVGNPIELSRYVVVMPAYCSLKVEANLWDSSGEIVNGNVEFQAKSGGEDTMFIKSPHASLQVKVRWREAYLQLYKHRILNAETNVVEDIKQELTQKKRRVIPGQPLRSSSSLSGSLRASTVRSNDSGFYLTEIFSICVGGITEEIHALCGTIVVQNGLTNFHIYNKDESCFELLEDNNIVSTEGPDHVIANCEFNIFINLRDPVRDLEVSRGCTGWNSGQLKKNNMSWLDKRLCSVIRGKNGFAAIHYMIFNNALRADVEVRFFSNSPADVPANVYGHLIAYYDGCDYSKSYQRKYYRSRLFELPQNKSVELMTGSKLTLSRSVVAVPTLCSLLIEADLKVFGLTGVCNSKKGSVSGTVEFEIDRSSCTRKEIKGDNCWIELSVKFQ